jgi:hypothetical protein
MKEYSREQLLVLGACFLAYSIAGCLYMDANLSVYYISYLYHQDKSATFQFQYYCNLVLSSVCSFVGPLGI